MKTLGLIIPYDYKLLSIAAILDVFETVNQILAQQKKEAAFQIKIFQAPSQMEKNGTTFHQYGIQSIQSEMVTDIVLIPSFNSDNLPETLQKNREFISWIQEQYNQGAEIASFCTGAFLIGASGLLKGKMATTHVDACSVFAASFPEVILKPDEVVTIDGRLFTSGGATSTFHLLLRIVEKYCGNEMAVRIAKIFAIDMDRFNQSYFGTFIPNHNHHDDLVRKVQEKIEENFTELENIEQITKTVPSSRRNLVRRFKQATGLPPIEYLQHIRIESAKKMLEQTNQQISEIIFNSGYNDPKSFRKTFFKIVGMTPQQYRKKFNVYS